MTNGVIEHLEHNDPQIRCLAIRALVATGCNRDEHAIPLLEARLADADVERRLNEAVQSLIRWRGKVGPTGRILDLSAFSDHKCEVWSVEPVIVQNPSVGPMKGRRTALGFPVDLWDLPDSELPRSARQGRLLRNLCFVQVKSADAQHAKELERFLRSPDWRRAPPRPSSRPARALG